MTKNTTTVEYNKTQIAVCQNLQQAREPKQDCRTQSLVTAGNLNPWLKLGVTAFVPIEKTENVGTLRSGYDAALAIVLALFGQLASP